MAKDELGDIEWLNLCTSRERAWVRRNADLIDVPAGSVLLHEGEGSRWFYAMTAGEATVTVGDDVVGHLGAGDLVNEVEVLRNEPVAATVTADTDLKLLVMGRREFLGMLDEIPGLARRLLMAHIPTVRAGRRRRPVLVPMPAA